MRYSEAIISNIAVNDAICEIELHGHEYGDSFFQRRNNGKAELFCMVTGETIAVIENRMVHGADVLAWLGY